MLDTFFKDLKVVELASVLAGPAVGMFFAELGAEVIKIENSTTGGDVTRNWRLPNEDKERDYSAYYCCVNWHKKTELLDLRKQEERQIVNDLIKEADIVITNFKSSSAQKIGMDYESVKDLNPKVIYAHLSSFGEGVDLPAFDVVLQAEAGFLFMTGESTGPPVKMPVALIDLLAAHQLKEAILIALIHKMKTGEGSFVTTSLLEAAISSLANQATNWLMEGHIPQRMGCKHPNIAPYGDVFFTLDEKPIILAVGTEKQFEGLCSVVNLEELTTDNRFKTNGLRVQNREELKLLLEPAIQKLKRAELLTQFQKFSVPAGSIRSMKEVFEIPTARKMVLDEQMADGNKSKRVKTVAFHIKNA